MVKRADIVTYCDDYLDIGIFKDYCPNGLQVEGKESIKHIVSGVTASQALIDAAIAQQAELLLVHHGFFWKGENPVLTGIKKRRLKALLVNDVNLLAYHLPLDANKTLGNNALLAKKLDIKIEQYFSSNEIALAGTIKQQSGNDFRQCITDVLGREPLHIEVDRMISKVALCTGAAQNYISQAIELGVDAFISGEVSENTWHIAKESNIHYFAAGHHATERYGVQALGEHLAAQFGLKHTFIDINNPV
ncbi:MAG: Nif3-like dinuclear metal center hexameric protein [gamma proteobacterium symbiont of Bathyaustriella thionipta]|nr:Nif3-like dinuclear metal center hexameric protein [gamma proteobacterium symbiont of Bathyaustriella thionipta]MCU7948414.1 Nif3-like dinuclear metal center hexameric protein [gamma proteobacterium symbiont of Bathyaustriella thionipta]MCU7954113.1 Nif3-like dinuclear metal center hexameric protein [gamma proteobacterium symbiont of Bathyaustriella thionipta]MCU7955406.1 Nif3-like dinuclear metal center hexameric protein [gamma proteobacterium symbiont of Bathyaustriella thionipta]MCU796675